MTAPASRIHIIGLGENGLEGLTAAARALVLNAELLLGADHLLRLVPPGKSERLTLGANLDQALERLGGLGSRSAVILASGDPLFYGTARYFCDRLGKDRFEVVPHVSSMQLAFARVKESWEDAYLTNLASHRLENILEKIRTADTVGLFTTEDTPPRAVAQALLGRGIDYFRAYVCENLGAPDECVTYGELAEIARQDFAALNVMILVRRPNAPDQATDRIRQRVFGNPDELFLQSRPKLGLLTSAEVRTIALAQLELQADSIVWDIGAGSGSVSIEAAQLAPRGHVYAIEMDVEDHALIQENAGRFHVRNLTAVLGRAPDAWAGLPGPAAIFVGGSGREVSRLVNLAFERLAPAGRLVANVGSIENLAAVHALFAERGLDPRVWMINVARGVHQLERVRFDALNPTFLLAVSKPAG